MSSGRLAAAAVLRTALFFALWIVLTEGRDVLLPGLPLALLTAAASLWVLAPVENWRLGVRLLALVPRLLVLALRSGWDVALRALRPSLPIDPDFIEFRLRRSDPAVATAMAYVMTLLPGSLAADLDDGSVRFHILDRALPVAEDVAGLERRLEAGG